MTYRTTKAILYRIFALVAAIALAALCWLAIPFASARKAQAADVPTHDGVFGANHANATALSEIDPDNTPTTGSYYLSDDVVLSKEWDLYSGNIINLCLHGHTITAPKRTVLGVYGSAVLNIFDCAGGGDSCGAITGGKGVYLYNGGTINLYSGAIQNAVDNEGVTVSGGAVFNMYGGEIKGCSSETESSGGVFIGSRGTFNMYGGSIHDNTTGYHYGGGGVYVYGSSATFHMYGGEIKNNVVDAYPRFYEASNGVIVYTKKVTEQDLELFYKGAGVNATTGTFTMEGDVVITGNYRISEEGEKISNVEVDGDPVINITGKLGDDSRIGITAPNGTTFTSGYADSGNTKKPSELFIADDSALMAAYDTLHKEAVITDDDGEYKMLGAVVNTPPSATVGDTVVKISVKVTLENLADGATKTITDLVTMQLSSPITNANKPTSYAYTYVSATGEVQTETLTFTVNLSKFNASVSWALPGATASGNSAAQIGYTGSDILSLITASYTGYDGNQKVVDGASGNVKITDASGNAVTEAKELGVYKFALAASDDYEFSNNLFTVTIGKFNTTVSWTCSGSVSTGSNSAKYEYDGNDILTLITATYVGNDGNQKVVGGASGNVKITDASGNAVTEAKEVGVYKFSLAPSADYEFSNNLFTVTIAEQAPIEEGYYRLHSATAVGVKGSYIAGDTNVTVIIKRTLKHTGTEPDRIENIDYAVTLPAPLHGGNNAVEFVYSYTSNNEVQTADVSVTVPADKKTVTVSWYFFDAVVSGNAATHVYDGADVGNKIVAVYDGIDGSKQRVDASSLLMVRKGENGNVVSSLAEVGTYTLSLADSTDYTFENNSFTYTVVGELSDITDLVYKEAGKTILGVSCEAGFENGTELAVKRIECAPDVIDDDIVEALDVRFVNGSAEVKPTGKVTVLVLIPDELRNGKTYNIYNLDGGVATKIKYSIEGNYAIFDSYDLSCIVFATPKEAPPIVDTGDDGNNGSNLTWLWILLAILGAGAIVAIVIIVVKRKKNEQPAASSETAESPARAQAIDGICPVCGCKNEDGAMFCESCGKKLEVVAAPIAASEEAKPEEPTEPEQKPTNGCPACGQQNEEGATFCEACGNKLK